MARPTVTHQGFFVPNAQDVAKPELAEPDRIDFNTVAHTRWGVLNGCLVTVSGTTATNTPGTALVDGILVQVAGGQNVSVDAGGVQDSFALIGVDDFGRLVVKKGAQSLDPVFPDPPLNFTTLAAVMCTAGGSSFTDNVIDKRKFLADSLLTKIPPEQDLLANRNGSGSLFKINGGGITSWSGDTSIQRHSEGTLRITTRLRIDETLVAGGSITALSLTATERITGSNLRNSNTMPAHADGHSGDIFQHNATGRIFVHQDGQWEEIATLSSATPVGTVITSLQPPAYMNNLGWITLDGSVVTEPDAPTLFGIPALSNRITNGTPKTMTLPDARRRVLIFDPDNIGSNQGQDSFTLETRHMPRHRHGTLVTQDGGINPVVRISRSGGHRHAVTGGQHVHTVIDHEHSHYGTDHGAGGQFITAAWGGQNKIDALFNDRSHTWSVDAAWWTRPAASNVEVSSNQSWHQHEVSDNGDHDHQVVIDAIAPHQHTASENEVGEGAAVPFTPAYLAVYAYIRS